MAKHRKVLEATEKETTKNRVFRTNLQSVVTYEQTIKVVPFFNPKKIVETDAAHTLPLTIRFCFFVSTKIF